MTPQLQQVLLGTPAVPPTHPKPTRSHRLWKDTHPTRHLTPLGTAALSVRDTLKGHKWWSIADLVNYLGFEHPTIYNTLARHSKKFGVESYVSIENKRSIKYFRIAPDVPS